MSAKLNKNKVQAQVSKCLLTKVQQSPRLSFNLREGLPSLFGLDERQGDGSGFKGFNALSRSCIFSTPGETGLFKTQGDTGLLVGIGMIWERFSLTVPFSVLTKWDLGVSTAPATVPVVPISLMCTGVPGWTDFKGMTLCR